MSVAVVARGGRSRFLPTGVARRIAKPFAFFVLVIAVIGWSEMSAAIATEFLSAQEAELARLLNAERGAARLPALTQSDALRTVARRQAQRMLAAGQIFHSETLQQDVEALFPAWQRIGENVGVGPNIPAVHKAFMESPGHRKNVLDPDFKYLGIGVVSGGSKLYMTENFLTLQAGAPRPVPPTFRFAGANRVAASQVLADFGFRPGGAGGAVVAPAGDFHHALAGAALAAQVRGPLVLSDSSALSQQAAAALARALGQGSGKTVHLVGGLAGGVESGIAGLGLKVRKVGSGDVVSGAAEIAQAMPKRGKTAFVTSAGNYQDAIPVAAVAAATGWPVLFTEPGKLSPATAQALRSLGITRTFVVGTPKAVSDAVVGQLRGAGAPVTARIGGSAVQISLALADLGLQNGMSPRYVQIAPAGALVDTTASGAAGAAVVGSPVLVSPGARLDAAVANWLKARKNGVDGVYVLGNANLTTTALEGDVRAALR